jgi:leucyl aminopeptidase
VLINVDGGARRPGQVVASSVRQIIAEATNFGREVINEPANVLTPTELAHRAMAMAGEYGLGIDVLEEKQMKELGMGALLGVSQGSSEPAKLIILTYTSRNESKETIAIVGKAVTFDTGGISIKPADGMEKMKCRHGWRRNHYRRDAGNRRAQTGGEGDRGHPGN